MINRKAQIGQILTSPFALIVIFFLMAIFVYLSVAIFQLKADEGNSGLGSAGIFDYAGKNLIFEKASFGGNNIFLAEAVVLNIRGELSTGNFEEGLKEILGKFEENSDKNLCFGFSYSDVEGENWKRFNQNKYALTYNSILFFDKSSGEISSKGLLSNVNEDYFNRYSGKSIWTSVFDGDKRIYVSYFLDDCEEVFK